MTSLLFVYGTLRPNFDGAMAQRLRADARHIGPGVVTGRLYRIADYPGLVPGPEGQVIGDLFALHDPATTLAWLDDYEECAAHHPEPHEYRREQRMVGTADGPVMAWAYIYARDITGLPPITGGDFLAE